jgi:glutathione S-transferase
VLTRDGRYLCDQYDSADRVIPKDPAQRARTEIFMHAAEGTLMLHAYTFFSFRSNIPKALQEAYPEAVSEAETKLSANVQKDLDWLEVELAQAGGGFLVGDTVTAADIMMMFSAQITFIVKAGTQGKTWPGVEAWIKRCEETASYKRAVEKSGFHTL